MPSIKQVDDSERPLALTGAELRALGATIVEVAGREAADEILFRVGQLWGKRDAAALASMGDASARDSALHTGLARLHELGLGSAVLDTSRGAKTEDGEIAGRVVDPFELRRGGGSTGTVCGVTVGYVTGFSAALTSLDVVADPFHCAGRCEPEGCTFEIKPAHRDVDAARAPTPSGSARFFLRSMGRAMAGGDISLDDLVENSADAIIFIDAQDIIRFWSRGAERVFLWQRDEVVGRRIGFVLPPDLLQGGELERIAAVLAREGKVQNLITRRVRKDGVELWVSLSRAVLHDSRGRVVGSTATLRDITAQKRTEDELQHTRSLAMVGELAAKVAHEVKNPLAGIYAAIQLLGRDVPPQDARKSVFMNVEQEIRRLDETVQDLLRFARPAPPRPRPTGLCAFVRELLDSLEQHPDVTRHEVRIDIDDALLVPLDARLMAQALTNLVLNAGQAMDQPGTIAIEARAGDDTIAIDVADTGPGIAQDQLGAIFEPFVTTKTRGTGLGLSIARKNVEAHGGTLTATNLERGASFRIVLPRALS